MNRINKLFQSAEGKILSIYFTAGYPLIDSTVSTIKDLASAGVDMIEIGMPFSDPLADGEVIQNSSQTALNNGMSIELLFRQLSDIRKETAIPLLLMGYLNPVLKFGIENFCRKCSDTGIDGVIIPDLPPDIYIEEYSGIFDKYRVYNIFLVTPQSDPERIRMIDKISRGFIYMVSASSTTGTRKGFSEEQLTYFERLNNMNLINPRLIGFGISDNDTYTKACSMSDGVIIGSAFVKISQENGFNKAAVRKFIESIRSGNQN
jgi:tryptophan synthase alpha chain